MESSVPTISAAPFDMPAISAALGDLACRFDVSVLAECDSTNSRLMALAEAGAASGSVLVAERQTAGRGRRGRCWISAPGDSLTFSLLWRFPQGTSFDGLSLAVGVALVRGIESLGISGIALKWPNDILCNGRKLAGVLVELMPGRPPEAAIVGIGLNLRLPQGLPDDCIETSAALSGSRSTLPTRNELLARLLRALHEQLEEFSAHGFGGVRAAWQARNAHADRPVRLLTDFAASLDGICRGVADDGALLLETADGMQRIVSGDVSLRAG